MLLCDFLRCAVTIGLSDCVSIVIIAFLRFILICFILVAVVVEYSLKWAYTAQYSWCGDINIQYLHDWCYTHCVFYSITIQHRLLFISVGLNVLVHTYSMCSQCCFTLILILFCCIVGMLYRFINHVVNWWTSWTIRIHFFRKSLSTLRWMFCNINWMFKDLN